ncbi:C-type lectin domain family 2 member B-like [Trachemys scripta elegans]|uniref:C-type lectin domain family 2 member B-like n=1 Tax=Trachemys scripta elegans TaxID=31138 RepID=UPI0015564534|nr:C-type lectin domain family 2 member B-like [Trachemys scripta elegans]
MGPAAGPAESEVPLKQLCVNGNGHLETGGEPEPHRNGKKCTVSLAVVFLGLIITVIVLAVLLYRRSSAALGPWFPACADGWIGYRGKCYYFSEAKGNWNHSQSHCSSLGAFLAAIDTQQDLVFMLRYKSKFDHWIGLRRDPGQPWKWANGTEFNNLFPITADGDCAYLNDENRVSSLRCTSERHWICSKPYAFTEATGADKSIVEISPEKT